jgi:hypothetical protein
MSKIAKSMKNRLKYPISQYVCRHQSQRLFSRCMMLTSHDDDDDDEEYSDMCTYSQIISLSQYDHAAVSQKERK